MRIELKDFKIILFSHKTLGLSRLAKFHLDESSLQEKLEILKSKLELKELMYLSTCNRIEFLCVFPGSTDGAFMHRFFNILYPGMPGEEVSAAVLLSGEEALHHLFSVASSLDSLVVGEREIITQVRKAYDLCRSWNLTGDLLRLILKKTVETAKAVYTHTQIARKPVSVVSLAYRRLRELKTDTHTRFLIVGAGVSNTAMAKYLKKHGFSDFAVFNRTLAKAAVLASDLGGTAYPLSALSEYKKGFDVIITCTGSHEPVITPAIYKSLLGADTNRKVVVDLAIPNDLDPGIRKSHDVKYIAVDDLKEIARQNLLERESELGACREIIVNNIRVFMEELKARKVELAMSIVPEKIKEIKNTALNEVFAKEIGQLDGQSKEILEKVISYFEKKYISMPMRMAREIMMDNHQQN